MIFRNEVLAEIVQRRPQSKAELMKIKGIGTAKAAEYGDALLKIIGVEPSSSESTGEPASEAETPTEPEVLSDGDTQATFLVDVKPEDNQGE